LCRCIGLAADVGSALVANLLIGTPGGSTAVATADGLGVLAACTVTANPVSNKLAGSATMASFLSFICYSLFCDFG
jgi:hypothetical protein